MIYRTGSFRLSSSCLIYGGDDERVPEAIPTEYHYLGGDEPERIHSQTSLRAAIWTGSHTGEKGGA